MSLSASPAFAPCGIPDPPLALTPPDELDPPDEPEPPDALAPPDELELPDPLAPPDELEPPDPPDELEPPPELPDAEAGVGAGDFEPDAGGELPQPATTSAMATSAAPSQVLPDLPNVLLMLRGLHPFRSCRPRGQLTAGDDEDAARCKLLPGRVWE